MPAPVRRTAILESSRFVFIKRTWDSQKPPFISPMYLDYIKHLGWDGNRSVDVRNAFNPIDYYSPDLSVCRTLAYGRLVSNVSDQAGWLINIHQRQQALDMMSNRLFQLVRFTKALRERKFYRAFRELGFRNAPPKAKWLWSKSLSKLWLEFHFGWEPIISDLYTSANLLQLPFFEKKVLGVSPTVERKIYLDAYNQSNVVVKQKVRQRCTIELVNPNLWLANSLGLVNPAMVAWDAVPWSFVLDWFSTLGVFLSSFTDFLGLKLRNASNSTKVEALVTTYVPRDGTGVKGKPLVYDVATKTSSTAVRRSIGLVGPSVHIRPLKGPSVTRAATAISLLTGFLPKH